MVQKQEISKGELKITYKSLFKIEKVKEKDIFYAKFNTPDKMINPGLLHSELEALRVRAEAHERAAQEKATIAKINEALTRLRRGS